MNLQKLEIYKKQAIIYLREAKKFRREYPQNVTIWQLAQFFPSWVRSLNGKLNPVAEEQPWITFAAIRFLEKNVKENMHVFEYGVGGSTLFFAKRAKEVVSVEHDPIWLNKITEIIKRQGYNNWHGLLIQPRHDPLYSQKDPSNPDAYISGSDKFRGYSFKEYVSSIDGYPDKYFDLVLIDGRARPSCFKHAIPKIKKNGYVIWDNTDRNYYFNKMNNIPVELEFIDLPGPSPYVHFFTRTSAWRCRIN